LIPESLDPLEELEVILEATFYETVDGDGFVDVVVCKGLLEDFEVLDILVLVLCLELGAVSHGHGMAGVWGYLDFVESDVHCTGLVYRVAISGGGTVYAVKDLDEGRALATLLDLGQIELEELQRQ
jgi:hypothetical protein